MAARIPLANSTVSATYPSQVPVPPSSDLSREAFDHFELTERLAEQAYFWTPEWQQAEHEADEDIRTGRIKRFFTAEELIADLDSPEY